MKFPLNSLPQTIQHEKISEMDQHHFTGDYRAVNCAAFYV